MEQFTGGDMKEYVQKIVDYVAQLSSQAQQVEGLQEQVNRLSERLNVLEQENYQLKQQAIDTEAKLQRVEHEADVTKGYLEQEKAVTSALRDTIVQRDAGVVSLEQDLRSERDTVSMVTRERDEARAENGDLHTLVQELRSKLQETTQGRESLASQLYEAEGQIKDLTTRLDRVNSILNPPAPVSYNVA